MNDNPFDNPEDEFREMMKKFLGAGGEINPEDLAKAAGIPFDSAQLANLMQNLMHAASTPNQGLSKEAALSNALQQASIDGISVTPQTRSELEQQAALAELWLSEVTTVSQNPENLVVADRATWVKTTIDAWLEIGEPVAKNISAALSDAIGNSFPEELSGIMPNTDGIMQSLGSSLFSMQLGQTVGQLSKEVITGGEIGISLSREAKPILVPQNIQEFAQDLDVPLDQIQLYLAARELAHARIFKHAKWLTLAVTTQVNEHSKGFSIDSIQINDIAESIDPSDPESMRELIVSGRLIPEKTPAQREALEKLETTLALIEGWVSLVTQQSCQRLPKYAAIEEAVRRRRATGGPAEQAFSTLVGLELRPKLMREAAEMWRLVGEEVGIEGRDALWAHPDLLPTLDDIKNPAGLIARITVAEPVLDDMDEELRKLLQNSGDGGVGADDGPVDTDDGSLGSDDSGNGNGSDNGGSNGSESDNSDPHDGDKKDDSDS